MVPAAGVASGRGSGPPPVCGPCSLLRVRLTLTRRQRLYWSACG
jgi:hypothetical protein